MLLSGYTSWGWATDLDEPRQPDEMSTTAQRASRQVINTRLVRILVEMRKRIMSMVIHEKPRKHDVQSIVAMGSRKEPITICSGTRADMDLVSAALPDYTA